MSVEFKIRVKTLEGEILTFHNVRSYSTNGGLVEFVDSKTDKKKVFSASACEIEKEGSR